MSFEATNMILFVVNVDRINSPFWWLEAYRSADGNIYLASAAHSSICVHVNSDKTLLQNA